MNNTEKNTKLEALLNDSAFVEALQETESKEDIQQLFEKNGLPLSRDEVDAFVSVVMQSVSDEVDSTSLEGVTGGAAGVTSLWIFETAYKGIKAVAKTCWNAGKKFANWGF